jgi:hypothetical protein
MPASIQQQKQIFILSLKTLRRILQVDFRLNNVDKHQKVLYHYLNQLKMNYFIS